MDARKIIIATSFFSAVLVLGVVVPLGFFSLQALDRKMEAANSEVRSVIIDLKAETLKEIRMVSEQAAKGVATENAGADPVLVASLEMLKTSIGALRNGQQQLFEKMKRPPEPVAATVADAASAVVPPAVRPVASPPPGSRDDTLNQTVFFSLGKITGPAIDQQVATMMPKIADYGRSGTCLSNVLGFSDTLGGDKSNLDLSQKRAQHVATLLRAQQVPVGEVKGWGERWLKVLTVDGIKNEQNRRVVIETVCEHKTPKSSGAVS